MSDNVVYLGGEDVEVTEHDLAIHRLARAAYEAGGGDWDSQTRHQKLIVAGPFYEAWRLAHACGAASASPSQQEGNQG